MLNQKSIDQKKRRRWKALGRAVGVEGNLSLAVRQRRETGMHIIRIAQTKKLTSAKATLVARRMSSGLEADDFFFAIAAAMIALVAVSKTGPNCFAIFSTSFLSASFCSSMVAGCSFACSKTTIIQVVLCNIGFLFWSLLVNWTTIV
ncbi:hypothetical protein KFK09_000154 [Dendrobium nobile]|uniref:Transmembrane protein n=1 Tax=Dendrobium nobile TaxID=94219 RepID=A0A8T3CD46_DENNO|nr:hypothetical protein KFK09_000154 [Dendrobium nobile]